MNNCLHCESVIDLILYASLQLKDENMADRWWKIFINNRHICEMYTPEAITKFIVGNQDFV